MICYALKENWEKIGESERERERDGKQWKKNGASHKAWYIVITIFKVYTRYWW